MQKKCEVMSFKNYF